MIKIITAMNNPKINEELKKEKNVELICKDIFYKEGILEILEKEININYIIINSELPGEIKLNNLIEKIIEKNEKIKIIILIKKENKNLYKIKNEKNNLKNNTKNNIEIIQDIKNKNIIKIFYNNEIKIEELKKYNKIKNNNKNNTEKNNKKIKNKTIIFLGERQVGKSITILGITKALEKNNKKILIIELNKKESDLIFIFLKNKKIINLKMKKQKIKKYKKINKKYFYKNNIKIIQKLIININKNIDIISYKKLINLNIIKKLEKNYDYIFIEINSEKNNLKNKKIIKKINEKILIIRPNILGIKNTKKIIEKNKINNYKIIINNYNNYSINKEIIKNIFKEEQIIGKIKYNQECDEIINNNLKINKENIKKIIKEYKTINI